MKAEQILKLVEAGFTKDEIMALEQDPEEKKDALEEKAEDLKSDIPEEKPVKKNPSSGSEEKEDEITVLKDKLNSLEQMFQQKAREEYREDAKPSEDLSLKSIFMSLDKEETKDG